MSGLTSRWLHLCACAGLACISGCASTPVIVSSEASPPLVARNGEDPCLNQAKFLRTKSTFVPPGADQMRKIADRTPIYPEHPLKQYTEVWIEVLLHNVILCRYNDSDGEWWTFEYTVRGPKLLEHSGWESIE